MATSGLEGVVEETWLVENRTDASGSRACRSPRHARQRAPFDSRTSATSSRCRVDPDREWTFTRIMHPRPRHRLVLDTTVLKLLVDAEVRGRFATAVDRLGVERVLVPEFSAAEAIDGSDGADRAAALVELAAGTRVPVRALAHLPTLIEHERLGPRRLGRPSYPMLPMPPLDHLLAVKADGQLHAWMRGWKNGLGATIVTFRAEMNRKFPQRSVGDLDEMLDEKKAPTTLLERESFGMAQIQSPSETRSARAPGATPCMLSGRR
jgi:hypothetical protein